MTRLSRRSYPPPETPFVMSMEWHDLLFMHWPVNAASIRGLVPASLKIDTWEGTAWVGITPFRMRRVCGRMLPPIPGLSSFLELNLRTYVTAEGKPGVWFFSLDAERGMAVEAARLLYGLPYFHAKMSCERNEGGFRYKSIRDDRRGVSAALEIRYQPETAVFHPQAGSFDSFLVDRYCLYAAQGDTLHRAEIDHAPWPLQRAEVEIVSSTMGNEIGQALPAKVEHGVYFARALPVCAWLPHSVEREDRLLSKSYKTV